MFSYTNCARYRIKDVPKNCGETGSHRLMKGQRFEPMPFGPLADLLSREACFEDLVQTSQYGGRKRVRVFAVLQEWALPFKDMSLNITCMYSAAVI